MYFWPFKPYPAKSELELNLAKDVSIKENALMDCHKNISRPQLFAFELLPDRRTQQRVGLSSFCSVLYYRTYNIHFQTESVNDTEKHSHTRLYHAFLYARYVGLVCPYFLREV